MRKKVEIDEIEERIRNALSKEESWADLSGGPRSYESITNNIAILATLAKHACDLRKVLDEVSKEDSDWRENTRLLNRVINVLSWGNGL